MQVDLLFQNADLFNVYTGTWGLTNVLVDKGRILYVGKLSDLDRSFEPEMTVDCLGKPVIPGLIDIHLHIESSLCTPSVFADTVIRHGVTTVVSEPHEIANVFGLAGIKEMIRVSIGSSMDILFAVPSSVPSTNPSLETTGGSIGGSDLVDLLTNYPEVVCLGEVMNYGDLIDDRPCEARELIGQVRDRFRNVAVEGHCPSIRDYDLAKVMFEGVDSDHCLQDLEGLKQRIRNGMFVEIQEKSVLPEIIAHLSDSDVNGLFCFVTDDVPPDVLSTRGHLDHVVRKALGLGMSLEKAIIASSRSPAARMSLRDRGAVSPGRIADLVILEDRSQNFAIHEVYKAGVHAEDAITRSKRVPIHPSFTASLKLGKQSLRDAMFQVAVPNDAPVTSDGSLRCLAMKKNTTTTYTDYDSVLLPVESDQVQWEDHGCNLALVVERYTGAAAWAQGFITGPEVLAGAFASTHSHDHHNLLVTGSNARDMRTAAEWVIFHSGGICIVSDGEIRACLALPVGGILSEEDMDTLSAVFITIQNTLHELGISHPNPFMSMSTITLPVSPALKITDKGMVDVRSGTIRGLFVDG